MRLLGWLLDLAAGAAEYAAGVIDLRNENARLQAERDIAVAKLMAMHDEIDRLRARYQASLLN